MSEKKTTDARKLSPERRELVSLMVDNINAGGMWRGNWYMSCPENATTGKRYRGINSLYLTLIAQKRGYCDNRWCTYNQMKKAGYTFKAQAEPGYNYAYREGVNIEFYELKFKKPKDKDTALTDEQIKALSYEERRAYYKANAYPVRKTYRVYNADILDGVPAKAICADEERRSLRAERFINRWSDEVCPISHDGQGEAFYSWGKDEIHLPKVGDFRTYPAYYETAFHEMAHSTGHGDRLNRKFYPHGTAQYALEEMRAEIAAVFACQQMEIDLKPADIKNASLYVGSYLVDADGATPLQDMAKTDKERLGEELLDAALDAQRISEYMMDKEKEFEKANAFRIPSEIDDSDIYINCDNLTDYEIVERASTSKTGDVFCALYNGKDVYESEEKNDECLLRRIAVYTTDPDRVKTIYRSSARKPKAEEYLDEKTQEAVSEIKRIRASHARPEKNKAKTGQRTRYKGRSKTM